MQGGPWRSRDSWGQGPPCAAFGKAHSAGAGAGETGGWDRWGKSHPSRSTHEGFSVSRGVGVALLVGGAAAMAEPTPPMQGRTDLAKGKAVAFSPEPGYSLTKKGGTDQTDLTDGKLGKRPDHRLWFESAAVGWSYPGRFNLAVDLGKACDIDEIAIRLQNGSAPGGGRQFPGWVEAFVSTDGAHYTKVGEFSQWNRGDFEKFGIGQGRGTSWVDCLRFKDLKAHGRWVGFRIYGNMTAVSDELYVFGKESAGARAAGSATPPTGFTVTHPQVYFHKPYLEVATNVTLPVPVGLDTPSAEGSPVTLTLEVPAGLELVGGSVGGVKVEESKPQAADGGRRYTFSTKEGKTNKVFGRIYLKADGWKDGQAGALRYQFGDGKWQSPMLSIPVHAVDIPQTPRLKTIMASLGWWNSAAVDWPGQLEAFRALGMNTFNVFGMWMPSDPKDPAWANLEEARKAGFFISNIDSPLGPIVKKHKGQKEVYDQFEDGTVGKKLCISYRGKYYQEEIQRFATMMAAVKPDFSSEDIELWGWAGPLDSVKCTRCQFDFQKSGLGSWAAWQQSKGKEMIHDLVTAARKAVKEAGGHDFSTGCYDFRPGHVYQQLFDFNALYPELLNSSQVSTYTSLQAADLEFIGDEARKDRGQLPRSDVMPWLTPGDAGVFPGESFQWALLECYANGSRGIWFWSSRMWDSEDLIAYNRVIRAIAPVEEVIVKGDLVGADAKVEGEGRISGMKQGNRMVLLAADYYGKTGGAVKVRLKVPGDSTLRDLMTGRSVGGPLAAGEQTVTIPLEGQRGRLLEVVPR